MAKTNGSAGSDGTAIHLSLQGKGGVGKSLISSILAQYLRCRGRQVHCVDTDPINHTLSSYKALEATPLELMVDGTIEQRRFDGLMERFLTERAAMFVVDNGASTFVPLWHYLLENNALEYLRENGRKVFVHTVVTGGQALGDTLLGFRELARTTQECNIVVWINEYFGRVEHEGKSFADMNVFRENADKVCGSVVIAKRNQDTFGRDVEQMIASKLTFAEAIESEAFAIMAKQRLKTVQRDLFEQLNTLAF
jgi:hypothetical protein